MLVDRTVRAKYTVQAMCSLCCRLVIGKGSPSRRGRAKDGEGYVLVVLSTGHGQGQPEQERLSTGHGQGQLSRVPSGASPRKGLCIADVHVFTYFMCLSMF